MRAFAVLLGGAAVLWACAADRSDRPVRAGPLVVRADTRATPPSLDEWDRRFVRGCSPGGQRMVC